MVAGLTIPAELGLVAASTERDIGDATNVFLAGIGMLGVAATFAAVLLGATAGSVDHQRGVLRDLVVAGRTRWRIPLLRMLAAALWLTVATAIALGIVSAFAVTLAPVAGSIDWHEALVENGVSSLPGLASPLLFGTGIALLVGSRGVAIGLFFLLSLVIDNILLALPTVGDWWQHVSLSAAEEQVAAHIGRPDQGSFFASDDPLGVAIAVLAAWALVPLVLGLVRLTRRDL